ncbi:MAG: DNA polymerase III subunit beta [Rhodocyclaceae bacterium]|jgi:DNA polymerase-3 subunit beta|nr:DNA polymerase III subunit beta [Rhodocyclaceae bacterium]
MLLFKGLRDQLLSPLQAVCGIVEKRHTLPILSNVLMQKKGDVLTLLATDIEIQITTSTIAPGSEDASITVGARKLQDILRSLDDGVEVSLVLEDKRLQLKSGKSRFNLQTLPADDFPRMTVADGQSTRLQFTQAQMKRLISLVQCAMAQQDIRYYLNGLLLVAKASDLIVVATDGHRLAYASETMGEPLIPIEVILPRKTVLELSRQLADTEDPLEIILTPTQARFRFGNIELVSKLIDGKFPDYERVIPQNHNKILPLNRNRLLQSLHRVAILTNEKFRGVRLVLATDNMKIMSSNSDQEDALEDVEVSYNQEPLDIGFNVTYLLDVLNNVNDEIIELRLADSNSSALFTIPNDDHFKYVVMPMRI